MNSPGHKVIGCIMRFNYQFVVTAEMALSVAYASDPPSQQPADQLLLLVTVAWPVPLHVLVEVIPQQVAVVFGIHFCHLKYNIPHDVASNV